MNRKGLLISIFVILYGCAGPIAAGPVGHWQFDDGSGTVVKDSSGNNFNGKLVGDPTWVTGKVGTGALSFDGSDGLVEIPDAPALDMSSRLTIATWVSVNNFTTYYFFVCKSPSGTAAANYPGNYEFRVRPNDGMLEFGHQTSTGQEYVFYPSSSGITVGKWYHVAVTFEKGGLVQFYIDGIPAGTAAQTANFGILNNEPVRIGGRKDGYSFFNGQLDDVRIYDRVLTAEQVQGLYNGVEPMFLKAEMPQPANGAMLDQMFAILQWKAGDFAVSQKVYFGETLEDVSEGRVEPVDTTGNTLMIGSTPPYATGLTPGKTYYWRVDGVNDARPDSPWMGDVWSFRVRPAVAWEPVPADKAGFVSPDQNLAWKKGLGALFHIVYFGDNFDTVNTATGGWMTMDAVYDPPLMELDKTYYWRVDEFTGPETRKGEVWSFTTVPPIEVAETTLLGHWTFDEVGAGSAVDWSGHGLHGIVRGNPEWADGPAAKAIKLDGVDDAFTTPVPANLDTGSATMTAWIRPTKVHTTIAGIIFHRSGAAITTCGLNLTTNNRLGYHWAVGETWGFNSGLFVPMNEWSFVALAVRPDQATLYLDGADIWATNTVKHPSIKFDRGLTLGSDPVLADRCFGGMLDDLRFYTKAMTAEEVEQVMAAGTKPPAPDDPMSIESFDGYNAYNVDTGQDVWDVWSDGYGGNGTGSTLGHATVPVMERVLTQSGGQSLPLYYDNSGTFLDMDSRVVTVKYSEIAREFDPPQDLTRNGATTLVVWLRGVAANTAETTDALYLVLGDGTKTAVVTLAQSDQLRAARWQKLTVALNGLDVDVTKIGRMAIGIGDRKAATPGGKGVVYIDNIALETP